MKVSVYTGRGASMAKDVMSALKKLNIEFDTINENKILLNKINCKILIFPGGWPQKYSFNLGESGFEKIRRFVRNGGRYIGICAGSDFALKRFEIEKANFLGIGLIDGIGKLEVNKILPGRIRTIKLDSNHSLSRNCPNEMKIWYQNGPVFKQNKDVEVVAKYENDNIAIASSKYGKGHVILFSPHPEGNLKNKIDPVKYGTINLLKNALV